MDLFEMIKLHESEFSKSEQKVSNYIMSNPKSIEMYTISKIGLESGTSTAAVQRFCQTLGYTGYKDFRFDAINYLKEVQQNKEPENLFDQFSDSYASAISEFKALDQEMLRKLSHDLRHASNIYIFGVYYSSLPAQMLSMGLQDMDILSHVGRDYIESAHLCRMVDKDSVVITFSTSANPALFSNERYMGSIIQNLPEKSYLITLNPQAQKGKHKYFTNTIILPGNKLNNQSIVDAQGIPMVFVESLLNLIHNKE